MILDPHIHSIYSSDSRMTPKEIVKYSRKIGLDAIAIADHNSIKGSICGIENSGDFDDFIVIPAMEVSTKKGHIVALGINDEIKSYMSPEDTIEAIRDMGGIAIAPHPFVRYREGLCDVSKDLAVDAVDTLNSRYIFG